MKQGYLKKKSGYVTEEIDFDINVKYQSISYNHIQLLIFDKSNYEAYQS